MGRNDALRVFALLLAAAIVQMLILVIAQDSRRSTLQLLPADSQIDAFIIVRSAVDKVTREDDPVVLGSLALVQKLHGFVVHALKITDYDYSAHFESIFSLRPFKVGADAIGSKRGILENSSSMIFIKSPTFV
jgi:hypothetical protein